MLSGQFWQIAVLFGVFVPLTLLWGYALFDCACGGPEQGEGTPARSLALLPLDTLTWVTLLVLAGWFAALAYLAVVVFPRLRPRFSTAVLSLRAFRAGRRHFDSVLES